MDEESQDKGTKETDSMLLSPVPTSRPRTVTCISAPDDSSPSREKQVGSKIKTKNNSLVGSILRWLGDFSDHF